MTDREGLECSPTRVRVVSSLLTFAFGKMHFGDWWGHSLSMVSCAAAERCSCLLAVSAASIVAVAMMESDV